MKGLRKEAEQVVGIFLLFKKKNALFCIKQLASRVVCYNNHPLPPLYKINFKRRFKKENTISSFDFGTGWATQICFTTTHTATHHFSVYSQKHTKNNYKYIYTRIIERTKYGPEFN